MIRIIFRLLVEMLQHSMKFSFNEPHTWTQYGLALSTERRHLRSLIVFRELAEKNQGFKSIGFGY